MTTAVQNLRRREIHSATAQSFSEEAAVRQMVGAYHFSSNAVIAPGFKFEPGYVYTQVRAISARINQNYDGWPSGELKKAYKTFLGKPIFVNHQNFDPKLARGKVVAARYVEAGDDKYVETVMQIDAMRFPKLAKEIKEGGLDSVSMGVEAGFTICSVCNNKAVDTPDFCDHVRFHKGTKFRTASGEETLVYEKCYRLGFFELSYVFDPADETAVVSRVISAAAAPTAPVGGIKPPAQIKLPKPPSAAQAAGAKPAKAAQPGKAKAPLPGVNMGNNIQIAALEAAFDRLAYGEIEAPEDVDTLRDQGQDDDEQFKHYVESPKELQGPDMDQTKRLDRAQESQGLDSDRRVEQVEDIGGVPTQGDPMSNRNARRKAARRGPAVLVDARTGQRYFAADDDPSAGGKSDEDLIQEAEADLEKADAAASDDFSEDPGSDAGGTDDDQSDADTDAEDGGDDDDSDDDDSGDLPPWLQSGGSPDGDDDSDDSGPPPPPPSKESRRNGGNRTSSNQKKRRKGAPMSLASRGRVASAHNPRLRHADDSGHTDGGPYHTDDNDQGEQEEVFLSQTPGSEAVSAPTPGDGTISNTENNLVARINRRNAELQRDIIAYEQITGRRVNANEPGAYTGPQDASATLPAGSPGTLGHPDPMSVVPMGVNVTGRRRQGEAVATPDQVNPALSGTDDQGVKSGDWDSIALDNVETQPNDGTRSSARAFAAFDSWLKQTTGRTARQHGNHIFIRRSAARYCQAHGMNPESLFPTLGSVLREAKRNESTNRRSNMQRRADESLDVAAPQDRIDVEKPVSDTTDADAQSSQFDLGDFGSNASDGKADPDLSADSQIWAPGEGDSSKTSNRKADGMTAVRYAEAYIAAGLAPNTPAERWKIAGLAQTMRHGTIVDRTRLLEAINTARVASARRTAGVNRGAGGSIPPGFGQRQMTAGQSYDAANDISSDVGLWLK